MSTKGKKLYHGKKRQAYVPEEMYEDTKRLSKVFHCTMPKAFAIREDIFAEVIKSKKTKKGNIIQIKIK